MRAYVVSWGEKTFNAERIAKTIKRAKQLVLLDDADRMGWKHYRKSGARILKLEIKIIK
jgi:hypothetical protein